MKTFIATVFSIAVLFSCNKLEYKTQLFISEESIVLKKYETVSLYASGLSSNNPESHPTWESSNNNVATVSASGMVYAVNEGQATITVRWEGLSASCAVTVLHCPKGAVDLGLVMTRADGSQYTLYWAESNLGTTSPLSSGDYYAWGESSTKSDYSLETYKWYDVSTDRYTKYYKWSDWISGGDKVFKLKPEDDVARIKLGGAWRMPTLEEAEYMLRKCSTTEKEVSGTAVYEVKGPNGNKILFLPGGFILGTELKIDNDFKIGRYWLADKTESRNGDDTAYIIDFNMAGNSTGNFDRSIGCMIRPVTE